MALLLAVQPFRNVSWKAAMAFPNITTKPNYRGRCPDHGKAKPSWNGLAAYSAHWPWHPQAPYLWLNQPRFVSLLHRRTWHYTRRYNKTVVHHTATTSFHSSNDGLTSQLARNISTFNQCRFFSTNQGVDTQMTARGAYINKRMRYLPVVNRVINSRRLGPLPGVHTEMPLRERSKSILMSGETNFFSLSSDRSPCEGYSAQLRLLFPWDMRSADRGRSAKGWSIEGAAWTEGQRPERGSEKFWD
jgi:hypothetical protein